jgi:hypothetical protein
MYSRRQPRRTVSTGVHEPLLDTIEYVDVNGFNTRSIKFSYANFNDPSDKRFMQVIGLHYQRTKVLDRGLRSHDPNRPFFQAQVRRVKWCLLSACAKGRLPHPSRRPPFPWRRAGEGDRWPTESATQSSARGT